MEEAVKVLLIEDDVDAAEMYRLRLVADGYEVVVAHDGTEGLRIAAAEAPPDFIYLDLRLPGLDGFEVLERLRADEATTAHPGHHPEQLRRAGVARARPEARSPRVPGQGRHVAELSSRGPSSGPPERARSHRLDVVVSRPWNRRPTSGPDATARRRGSRPTAGRSSSRIRTMTVGERCVRFLRPGCRARGPP